MITVINFSHALNEKAKQMIVDNFGCGDAVIHQVSVQLYMKDALAPQLAAIEKEALTLVGGNHANVDCIIPPGHPVASSYLSRKFLTANIIAMVAEGTPTQFFPSRELIRPR